MGDYPLDVLGGKTPLQAAEIPHVRRVASRAECRMVATVPEGMAPGSDVANLSLLGYDPSANYTGRAPIEAAGAGIPLAADDVAFRCNLVTIADGLMEDYSAGHISTEDAAELLASLDQELGRDGLRFHTGVSYRHLLVVGGGNDRLWIEPPHEFSGQPLAPHVPADPLVRELIEASVRIFRDHPVNRRRVASGLRPATQIWLWGQGKSMQLPTYEELYGIRGGVISAVDLVRGLGLLAGLEAPRIPGATGFLDTNVEGKVAEALRQLERGDFLYFHLEAPDECGHMGDVAAKVQAIELYDRHVVGPLWAHLEELAEPYMMLLCMDHRTPVQKRGHTSEPVPMALLRGPVGPVDTFAPFDETVNHGVAETIAYDWIRQILEEAFRPDSSGCLDTP